MTRNWEKELKKFEEFLSIIDIQKYAYLRQIKTVEQDLPIELLPLEIFYRYYWDTTDFKDYDKVFEIYWSEKLNPYIYEFIKKYFMVVHCNLLRKGLRQDCIGYGCPSLLNFIFNTYGTRYLKKR